jgi:uncharacterized repeat protein (TIGR02543 family)
VVKRNVFFRVFLPLLALVFLLSIFTACDKKVKVESISLDKEEIVLAVGASETITAEVHPDNATDKTVTWTSEDESIATVANGVVTAIGPGETDIVVQAGEITTTVKVIVKRQFTVTFNTMGGSAVAAQQVLDGSKVTKPADPTREGFAFVNWYKDSGYQNVYDFNTPVTGNLILYAKWAEIKYTVTFEVDGGTEISAQQVSPNGKAVRPNDPVKTGHIFEGWFADSELTTPFDFNATITADTVVYAKWRVIKVFVIFNSMGGSMVPGVEIDYGETVEEPEEPTRPDYIFVGWFKDLQGLEPFDFTEPIEEDVTIFAKWDLDTSLFATISFEVNGGLFPLTQLDELITVNPSNTHELGTLNTGYMTYYKTSIFLFKRGYTGNDWAVELALARNADGMYEIVEKVAAGTPIGAGFKEKADFILVGHDGYLDGYNFLNSLVVGQIVTITGFDIDTTPDGSLDPKGLVKVYPAGTKIQLEDVLYRKGADLPRPQKAGYEFLGWYTDADFSGEPLTAAASDGTLYARWAKLFNVTYELNGGVNDPENKAIISEADLPFTLAEPTREGYDFLGWYENADLSGSPVTMLADLTGDITLYAKWEHEVTFMDGEIVFLTQKVKNNALLTRPDDLVREGQAFLGWFVNLSDEDRFDFTTPITGNLILHAKWVDIVAMYIDWEAKYNADLEKWFIKVTPENETLDQDAIKEISLITVAGKLLETPQALTPDEDPALWFSVASKNGLPIIKADGVYTYRVVKKDDTEYYFAFEYKNELVTGLPEPIEADIDYRAVWNGELEKWFIEISVAGEQLDANSIKAINRLMEAGVYVDPVALTPDEDTVMWFSVAGKNGLPLLKEAGKYMYEVTRADDSVYVFWFDYDPEAVLDLPEIIDATVDYNAVWNEALGKWYIKLSVDGDLDADTIARIAVLMTAGKYVEPVELVPDADKVLWFAVADIEANISYREAGRYLFEVERKADGSVYVFGFDYEPDKVEGLEHVLYFQLEYGEFLPKVDFTAAEWSQVYDVGAKNIEGYVFITDAYELSKLDDDHRIFNAGYSALLDSKLRVKYFVDRWGREWTPANGWTVKDWDYGLNHYASYYKPYLADGDVLILAGQYGAGLPEGQTYRNHLGNILISDLGVDNVDHRNVAEEDLTNPGRVQFIIKDGMIGADIYRTWATVRVAKGETAIAPEEPERAGYAFTGWYKDADLTEEFDFDEEIEYNRKIYPKWELIVREVEFHLDGGEFAYPVFHSKEEMVVAFLTDLYDFVNATESLSDFMHGVGKTEGFDGLWYNNATYKNQIYNGARPTAVNEAYFISSSEYMDKWLPLFDVLEEFVNGVNPDQHFYGDSYTGFLRMHVYIRSAKPWSYVPDEVYALFPAEYLPVTYSIRTAAITLPVPEKADFVFRGWFDNPEFSGDAWTEIPTGYQDSLTLYAKWEAEPAE